MTDTTRCPVCRLVIGEPVAHDCVRALREANAALAAALVEVGRLYVEDKDDAAPARMARVAREAITKHGAGAERS